MFKPRPCGCKGIRTCLICEEEFGVTNVLLEYNQEKVTCEYCHFCQKAWEGSNVAENHPDHNGQSYDFPGILLIPNFISEREEDILVEGCDSMKWDLSQSGRRKQNFGPKTNFKKKKINGKSFLGFPDFSKFAQEKLQKVDLLSDFETVEQCAIEYRVETGASIDPHIDDCWVWGERVISINLLSDSVLTMTKYQGDKNKYNLNYYYEAIQSTLPEGNEDNNEKYPTVRIPMPARSLLVLYGPARYEWEHCVYRHDISQRRICMAYREFTPEYLKGGKHFQDTGSDILSMAKQFWTQS